MARIGTAAHKMLELRNLENDELRERINHLAFTENVDADELAMLVFSGRKIWREHFADVISITGTEMHIITNIDDVFLLSGTCDIAGSIGGINVIVDWKTGYREYSPAMQTMGYHVLQDSVRNNRLHMLDLIAYKSVAIFARLGTYEVYDHCWEDIQDMLDEIKEIIATPEPDRKYNPDGANCMYCPRALECPARLMLMYSSGRDILAMTGDGVGKEITTAKLAALYPQSRVLKKALENYESILRAAVEQAGGKIAFDGGEIVLNESPRKTILWNPEVLRNFLSADQVAGLRPTISRKELEQAVSDGAPIRQKGKAKELCIQALKDAGSVEEKLVKSIEYRKV
jgi:CRISPR/Cas system-associated exonuclease Cas4 (RecB family)